MWEEENMIKQNTLGFWLVIFCFLIGLNMVFFYTNSNLKIYFSCMCMLLSFILVIILYQQKYINFLCLLFFVVLPYRLSMYRFIYFLIWLQAKNYVGIGFKSVQS